MTYVTCSPRTCQGMLRCVFRNCKIIICSHNQVEHASEPHDYCKKAHLMLLQVSALYLLLVLTCVGFGKANLSQCLANHVGSFGSLSAFPSILLEYGRWSLLTNVVRGRTQQVWFDLASCLCCSSWICMFALWNTITLQNRQNSNVKVECQLPT